MKPGSPELEFAAPEQAAPKQAARFYSLKIGTCITSSWVALLTSGYLTLSPFTPDQRGNFLFVTIGLGVVSSLISIIRAQFKNQPSSEEQEISFTTPDISIDDPQLEKELREKIPVRLFTSNENRIAYSDGREIYFAERAYAYFKPPERTYVIRHEKAHIQNRDIIGSYALLMPVHLSVGLAPFMPVGAFVAASASQSPLVTAFATAGGALAAGLGYLFTKTANHYARRQMEYRADHDAVEESDNPVAAISALAKCCSPRQYPFHKQIWMDHPNRNQRILRIGEDFSAANPDRALIITPTSPSGIGREQDKNAYLRVDTRNFDGHLYRVGPCVFERIM